MSHGVARVKLHGYARIARYSWMVLHHGSGVLTRYRGYIASELTNLNYFYVSLHSSLAFFPCIIKCPKTMKAAQAEERFWRYDQGWGTLVFYCFDQTQQLNWQQIFNF